jgi:ParB family chromosome partitioning protein
MKNKSPKKPIDTSHIFPLVAKNEDVLEQIENIFIVDIARVVPADREDQPRDQMLPEDVLSLAADIKEERLRGGGLGGTGVLQSVTVRLEPGAILPDGSIKPDAQFIIVAGETRFWATKESGGKKLPISIQDISKDDALEYALRENIQRSDPSPLSIARAVVRLAYKHGQNGKPLTHAQIAERLRKSKNWVQIQMDVARATEIDPELASLLKDDPDSLSTVQRIGAQKDERFRASLKRAALNGASMQEIAARIKAHRMERAAQSAANSTPDGTSGVPMLPRTPYPTSLEMMQKYASNMKRDLERIPPHHSQRALLQRRTREVAATLDDIKALLKIGK